MIQNIFIAHTPFHVFMSEEIVCKYFMSTQCINVLFLELNHDYEYSKRDLWSSIEFLENVGSSTLGRKRFLMSERNIECIKQYSDKNKETNIFMSDISWPMNNRIFFDNHLRSCVKYSLFSDGLGTYALPKVTNILFLRGVAKSINGVLNRGVRYKNYLGNQFGIDRKEIEYIYAPSADLIKCDPLKWKDVSLDVNYRNVTLNNQKCLFLDEPFWLHMQENEWLQMREVSARFIKSLPYKEVYYKNHHRGRNEDMIYYRDQGFDIIKSNKCAEQIVAENEFGIVVSYIGSALFNLKCMYHDKIRCISLCSDKINLANGFNDNTSEKVVELFNVVNVEMIDIF